VTVDHAPSSTSAVDADTLTATILTAVERQLTRYFAAMSHQAEEAKLTAERSRAEIEARLPQVDAALDAQRLANERYQQALQTALEERLSEFANHQHWRLNDVEDRLAAMSTEHAGVSPEDLMEIRQTVRDDNERSFAAINARLEELLNHGRRHDEQATALVQHVNDTTAALAQRMDEGDERVALAVEQRLNHAQTVFTSALADVEKQVGEHTAVLVSKLDAADSRVTDRMLALESRINDEQGTKLANIEATIGRMGAGFDDAMVAVSQRVLEMENRILELVDVIDALAARVDKFDQDAIDDLKAEMSNAIGEAMLVRIELDRVVASSDERFDKQSLRMGEIEAVLNDAMDVSASVQLERLDELERAVSMLDPTKFGLGGVAGGPSAVGPVSGTVPRVPLPAMTLNPRLDDADTHMSDASSHESDSHYSPY
jgi:hypothetical protein